LWEAGVKGTVRNANVYRLAISGPKKGWRDQVNADRYDIVVQFRPASRHLVPYGEAFHGWSTLGFPEHSTDAQVTTPFGGIAVEDGKFPWRVLGSPPVPYGSVIAMIVPEPTGPTNHTHLRIVYPTWRYPDKYRIHIDMNSPFPLGHVADWEDYFANQILNDVLSKFGQARPNPTVRPEWIFRLVYVPAHNAFAVQGDIPPSSGPPAWKTWDTNTGEAFSAPGGVALDVFEFDYQDYMEGKQLYACQTVLGMHFEPTAFPLERYDYDELGHDRRTGSVAFENTDCRGRPGDPSKREFAACGGCIIAFSDGDGGRTRPVEDTDLGFNTAPDGTAVGGVDGAKLDNWIITNWHLCNIREALCAINANLQLVVTAVDDFKAVFDARMMELIQAMQNLRLGVDTSGLEQAIRDHTSAMVDLWEIRP
jgi:hypothetical protein